MEEDNADGVNEEDREHDELDEGRVSMSHTLMVLSSEQVTSSDGDVWDQSIP